MTYGPYDSTFGRGLHTAQFKLQVDNTSGSDVVATLDVVTAYGANFLARREIRRNEFAAPNQWQTFTVEFNNPCFGLVEGRVYWHDTVNMKFNQLTINTVSTVPGGINWFVTDQLGTPRMVFDKTGTLASTKRHDYLPFGEELFANGRTPALGYGFVDGVRQKFTGYERDSESGLDYAQARYYSSSMGRFTSVDPLGASGSTRNPQSFNRYAYVLNNPLNLVDPTGMVYDRGGGLFGALASPWSDIPWTTGEGYAEVVGYEITGVEGAANGTDTASTPPPQDNGRILIIVGDPGLGRHNAGTNFDRVAETKRQQLEAQGYTVIVVRASSDTEFANALTNNGVLNGVEYIGHASYDALHVGQETGAHTNLTSADLSMLSNANLSADAYVKLVACYAGSGADNIAQGIATQLQRTTLAFDGGTIFSGNESRIVTETTRSGQIIAPRNGPLYLIEDRGTRMRTFPP